MNRTMSSNELGPCSHMKDSDLLSRTAALMVAVSIVENGGVDALYKALFNALYEQSRRAERDAVYYKEEAAKIRKLARVEEGK